MMKSVAVFVDGDNLCGKHAAEIKRLAKAFGQIALARVYFDASRPSQWLKTEGFHFCHAGVGKNASDILMSIDAMERSCLVGDPVFVIASSDGDFKHLALRLRGRGHRVIGLGEAKAPDSFRSAASDFVELTQAQPVADESQLGKVSSEMDQNIRKLIARNSKNGIGMRIADLATQMRKEHGVLIGQTPERKWRAYLNNRPTLFDLDASGPDAKVRFKPNGFCCSQ